MQFSINIRGEGKRESEVRQIYFLLLPAALKMPRPPCPPPLYFEAVTFSPPLSFFLPPRGHTKRPRARFSFPGRSQTSSLAFPQKKREQYRKDKTYFKYAAFLGEMNLEKGGNVYPPLLCLPLAVGGRSHLPPFCMRRRGKNLINALRETVFPSSSHIAALVSRDVGEERHVI